MHHTDGVYTDGAAIPNPGPGGWAALQVHDGQVVWTETGSTRLTTNNRMEMRAVIEAFKRLPVDAKVTIYTDSQLTQRTIEEWGPKWAAAGWRKRGGAIMNLDLVREALRLRGIHPDCQMQWIRGHDGNRWNERADELANQAARKQRSTQGSGPPPSPAVPKVLPERVLIVVIGGTSPTGLAAAVRLLEQERSVRVNGAGTWLLRTDQTADTWTERIRDAVGEDNAFVGIGRMESWSDNRAGREWLARTAGQRASAAPRQLRLP